MGGCRGNFDGAVRWYHLCHLVHRLTRGRNPMKLGDRVRILRTKFVHPDLDPIAGAVGDITLIAEPWNEDPKHRLRYEVCWPEPRGPRGYTGHFPFYESELEIEPVSNEFPLRTVKEIYGIQVHLY